MGTVTPQEHLSTALNMFACAFEALAQGMREMSELVGVTDWSQVEASEE